MDLDKNMNTNNKSGSSMDNLDETEGIKEERFEDFLNGDAQKTLVIITDDQPETLLNPVPILETGATQSVISGVANVKEERDISSEIRQIEILNDSQISDPEFKIEDFENETPGIKTRRKKPHKCEVCGLRYRYKTQLMKHSLLHQDGKIYKCKHCKRVFSTEHYLKKHVTVTHSKIKLEKDSIGVINWDNLKAHKAPLAMTIVKNSTKVVQSSKGNFPCTVCGLHFKRNRDLFHHTLTHTGERPFGCDICGKTFPRKSGLNRHQLVHSTEKPYKCDQCDKAYAAKDMLYSHKKIVHATERPFSCDDCGKSFALRCLLKRHFLDNHAEKKFPCEICGNTHRTVREAKNHAKTHGLEYVEPEYECTKCNQKFVRRIDLIRHKSTHATKRLNSNNMKNVVFQCDHCGRTYATERLLEAHSKIHGPPQWLQCEICGQHYRTVHTLAKHHKLKHSDTNTFKFKVAVQQDLEPVKPHHRDREGNYQCLECGEKFQRHSKYYRHRAAHNPKKCDICGKTFLFNYNLKLHKMIHDGIKRFKCEVCQQKFAHFSTLKRHMILHSGEKPFQCDICGRGFAQKGNFNKHKRTHAGNKVFQCDVCGRRFAQKESLEKHHQTHLEKFFQCLVCDKTFASRSGLNRHSAIHLEERQHECEECGRKFAQFNNLKLHRLTHTGERPFGCDHCEKRFTRKGDLKKHYAIHAGDIYIQEAELEVEMIN